MAVLVKIARDPTGLRINTFCLPNRGGTCNKQMRYNQQVEKFINHIITGIILYPTKLLSLRCHRPGDLLLLLHDRYLYSIQIEGKLNAGSIFHQLPG